MPRAERSLAASLMLLVLAVGLVAGGVSLLAGAVLLPGGEVVGLLVAALAVFLGAQLLVFRVLRLRSRADEPLDEAARDPQGPTDGEDVPPDAAGRTRDWRAWRG